MPNLVQIGPWGASGQIGEVNSPTGQTPERILTRDGSKDSFSRKDVPFGG